MDSWCDLAARTTYKELSVPKNNELEVSWILSPYLAHFICDSSGKKAVSDDEMRALLNDYDNYCLVSKEEGSKYKCIDDSLKAKHKGGIALTADEEKRAKQQIKFLFNHDENCPRVFLEAAELFYNAIDDRQMLWSAYLQDLCTNSCEDEDQVDGGDPWRDSYRQRQYREQSSSRFKDSKDVSHKLSIETARFIEEKAGKRFDDGKMRDLLNDGANLRMVDSHTNRSDHRKIDRSLMNKYETGEPLTARERERAVGQIKVVKKVFQENYPKAANEMFSFYKGLNWE